MSVNIVIQEGNVGKILIRARGTNEGMQMEAITVDGWLKFIKGLKNE